MQVEHESLTFSERFAATLRYAEHSDNPTVISAMERLLMVCRLADAPGLDREFEHELFMKRASNAALPSESVIQGYVNRSISGGHGDELAALENYVEIARRSLGREMRCSTLAILERTNAP